MKIWKVRPIEYYLKMIIKNFIKNLLCQLSSLKWIKNICLIVVIFSLACCQKKIDQRSNYQIQPYPKISSYYTVPLSRTYMNPYNPNQRFRYQDNDYHYVPPLGYEDNMDNYDPRYFKKRIRSKRSYYKKFVPFLTTFGIIILIGGGILAL